MFFFFFKFLDIKSFKKNSAERRSQWISHGIPHQSRSLEEGERGKERERKRKDKRREKEKRGVNQPEAQHEVGKKLAKERGIEDACSPNLVGGRCVAQRCGKKILGITVARTPL